MADVNTGLASKSDMNIPSKDDLETYRILFELFDRDKSSFIDASDLQSISVKLSRDPEEGNVTILLAKLSW